MPTRPPPYTRSIGPRTKTRTEHLNPVAEPFAKSAPAMRFVFCCNKHIEAALFKIQIKWHIRIMRTITVISLLSIMLGAWAATNEFVNSKMAEKAALVLRGTQLTPGRGSKYIICDVQVSNVFKNTSGRIVGKTVEVAAYSYRPGVPSGESTFYLEPYNKTDTNVWRLAGGEASTGISHNK